jgi:thioredoxin 1
MKVFTASWCAPCQDYKKALEGLDCEIIEVEENIDMSIKYGVYSVPTTILEKDGVVVQKLMGVQDRGQLEQLITQYEIAA